MNSYAATCRVLSAAIISSNKMMPRFGVPSTSSLGQSEETIQSIPCLSSLGTGNPLISTGSLYANPTSMKPMLCFLHISLIKVDFPIPGGHQIIRGGIPQDRLGFFP